MEEIIDEALGTPEGLNMRTISETSWWNLLRILAGVAALPLTVYTLLVLRAQILHGFNLLGAIAGCTMASASVLCWSFAVRGHIERSRRQIKCATYGGLILGSISFAAGLFG